jgi:hypothetical protein
MTDPIERELRGLDGDRPLPPDLYARLEGALLEDADARGGGADDLTTAFGTLDAPRPVPASTRAALEQALIGAPSSHRRTRVFVGIAAAALLVVGSVAALRVATPSSNHDVAASSRPSVPAAGVPPVLHAPTTAGTAQASAAAGAARATEQTTRRKVSPTTTTPWDCGLCAQKGYAAATASSAAPAEPATPGAPQPAAATLGPGISAVDPSSGTRRGGTIVTLTGYGFTGASGVRFGSLAAVNFTVVSNTEIRVQTPASPTPQKVTVSVTYADGTSTTTSDNGPFFSYT